jgi:hypothetical protein
MHIVVNTMAVALIFLTSFPSVTVAAEPTPTMPATPTPSAPLGVIILQGDIALRSNKSFQVTGS